jgi:hypothetical protein
VIAVDNGNRIQDVDFLTIPVADLMAHIQAAGEVLFLVDAGFVASTPELETELLRLDHAVSVRNNELWEFTADGLTSEIDDYYSESYSEYDEWDGDGFEW